MFSSAARSRRSTEKRLGMILPDALRLIFREVVTVFLLNGGPMALRDTINIRHSDVARKGRVLAILVAKRAVRPGGIGHNSGLFAKTEADAETVDRLLAQSDKISAQVRQAYVDAVRRLQSQVDVARISDLLEAGRISEALQQINAQSVAAGFM